MSKLLLKVINYRSAVLCNTPLFVLPFIYPFFWQLGGYTGDGYRVSSIVASVEVIYIIPALAISLFLLWRAARERTKSINSFALKVSMAYGLTVSIYLVSWLLILDPIR